MTTSQSAPAPAPAVNGTASDYGSDLDTDGEDQLSQALSQFAADAPAVKPFVPESIEQDDPPQLPSAHVPRSSPPQPLPQRSSTSEQPARLRALRSPSVEVEYDNGNRTMFAREGSISASTRQASTEPESQPAVPDDRSPLERFRTAPKKPLSVTDIVSPAWCELQYWYSLTKHGRKKRTPAMKQGSKVHKVLEEQVHHIVPVTVQTREDGWGLRIWNVIQGLRTLRATGLTRELEIWGVIDGQVVNGIIDELSYTCPDEALEESMSKNKTTKAENPLPRNQRSLRDLWKTADGTTPTSNARIGNPHLQRKIYLSDVKTRGGKTIPQGASVRPTVMQLMLYRKLLAGLASNSVNAETLFSRYSLKPSDPFTDAFIAEVGGLDYNFREDSNEDFAPVSSQQDSVVELLEHNSLNQIWSLMIAEFSRTMSGPDSIGDVLKAEYRSSSDGKILGSRCFAYDDKALQDYLDDEMKWWKGEREARGVDIEEAFKCRICEFAAECTWRKAKIDEATEKHRLRMAKNKSEV
ncbi:hypothetical protein W97_04814 [Coniosporium apollinis CBS 100218]|uniref:Exonuclease V n=1 Tax=Coniosporium apollinis (strain CBS 100218) TaxID=1168221 RepID=R7YV95_CONA1|nr:uncharacterized protein W97_04814 [Coniosporium apollinis CBS 100218]EON65576.1 hypothetical protein W97_04814 [Coniosporium apollinis CBS 100218]